MKHKFILTSLILSIIISFFSLNFASCSNKKELFSQSTFDYFDTICEFSYYTKNKREFDKIWNEVNLQLRKYHQMFDIYNPYEGQNNAYSMNNAKPDKNGIRTISVSSEMIELVEYCKNLYNLTNGKLNIAAGSVFSIWNKIREASIENPENASLPNYNELKAAAIHCDFDNVIVNSKYSTIEIRDKDLLFDFGSVAKGFAAKKIKDILDSKKITGYILNLGGAVTIVGTKPHEEEFIVGIEKEDHNSYIQTLKIKDASLVTSGSYQRYYMYNGKKYCHIIDMDTLRPADTYVSVSVFSDDPLLADAMSTYIFSSSSRDALELIRNLKEDKMINVCEILWFYEDGKIIRTDDFPKDASKK